MYYINTKTNQYPISEQDIRNEFSNTSFSTPFEAPEGYSFVFLSSIPHVINPILQTVKETTPVIDSDGKYNQVWEVVDKFTDYIDTEGNLVTKAEQEAAAIARDEEQKKTSNKEAAMRFLKETDWVEVPSVSDTTRTPHLVNFEEFMTYRMALRVIAVNPSVTATFPELPQEVWSN